MEKIKEFIHKARLYYEKAWLWYKNLYKGSPWWKKTLATIGSLIVAFLLYLGAVDVNLFWLFGKSPGFSTILDPTTATASELYTCDGVLIGKYFSENRTPVTYEDVNPEFWRCLIDTEDERFYKHMGIDFMGLVGAAKDAVTGRGGRGASTITQQLAKNMFRVRTNYSTGVIGKIPGVKILIVKTKEWIIATKLELCYDKKKILTMYANTVDFGSNSFGIKTAARNYFKTTPKELTVEQSAVLVGMLQATTYYNPKRNPENSKRRRNQVLDNMVTHGDLTVAECDSLKQLDITLSYGIENNYDGQAQYFREAVADELKEWCDENGYDLYTSGLKIYTTIDSRMQNYAEESAAKQMRQIQKNFNEHWGSTDPWQDQNGKPIRGFIEDIIKRQPVYKYLTDKFPENPDSVNYYLNQPHPVKVFSWDNDKKVDTLNMSVVDSVKYMVRFMHCSMVAMEPQTGHVKAYVGDIDFKSWKYDKARARRQPGSTFKMFVYTEAMNQGLTPCDKRRDEPVNFRVWDSGAKKEINWSPKNSEGYFTYDSLSLKVAFARSINSVAVRLGQEMGLKRIAETAHKMGVNANIDDTAPSMPLGSSDVSLLEMVNSYCTIAADGQHHKPVLVTKIVDMKGREVYLASDKSEQAIPYRSAFLMQKMLQGGLNEAGGTSQSLRRYIGDIEDTDFGGKTGTSNNQSDAWFMGVTPKLVVGAWVGGEYRCIHFRTTALGQGARTALPICGAFLEKVLHNPDFKQYHGHFPEANASLVSPNDYNCSNYYYEVPDTLDADTLVLEVKHLDMNIDPADLDMGGGEPRPLENEIKLDDF